MGLSPYSAAADTISGRATKLPWSGYWWPYLESQSIKLYNDPGPMKKYDQVNGSTAWSWEYNNHRTTDPNTDWWGHCQAWSGAAIIEPETAGRTINGVEFSQDDVEGLYSETWTVFTGWMVGTRYDNQGTSSVAYQDVYPADFDAYVRYWIGQQKTPLLMDFSTDYQVWSYPVYAFTRDSRHAGDKEYVTMTLRRAQPRYGVSGTRYVELKFYYTLQKDTKGLWYNPDGSSVDTHPDYIFRVGGRADNYGNPNVKPDVLNRMFR